MSDPMKFLEFLFTWIGRAFNRLYRMWSEPDLWFGTVAFMLLGGLAFCGYQIVKTDGRIDYCYVDKDGANPSKLIGHRPWRLNADLRVASESENEDVLYKQAKELGCPIK
jgi:hypothetical protein